VEVEIKQSKIHGKGVFAKVDLSEGTILTCDVILCNEDEYLKKYIFRIQAGFNKCIHIGFGSFLNGSKHPNIRHMYIDPSNLISSFKIIKEIKKGEELTLFY
jgi:hypothetical protein